MNFIPYFFLFLYLINYSNEEKIVEINFFQDFTYKGESDFSELIKNNLFTTFLLGSNNKKVDIKLSFDTPYFSISYNYVENSTTLRPNEPHFTYYSKTEFYSAQKSEEKIKLNEEITIDDFKFICDQFGGEKLGLNLNIENNELEDFTFIKELLRNKLIETHDIKILYNENNFISGKIIFGAPAKYTIPMHVEKITIFCFKMDTITYQGEDYTTEVGIDFNSAGIVAPSSFYDRLDQFFEPYMNNNTCKYIVLPKFYESSIFCYDNFTNIENFGKIYFVINDFNFKYTFILEGKELFKKVNNGYLFLIRSFVYYTADKWVLGSPFFGKYPITFNLKKYLIGFDINKENIIEDESNNNSDNILPWILVAIFGLLFILVIAFNIYFFLLKKQRKIRANELDEEILYNPENEEYKSENKNDYKVIFDN